MDNNYSTIVCCALKHTFLFSLTTPLRKEKAKKKLSHIKKRASVLSHQLNLNPNLNIKFIRLCVHELQVTRTTAHLCNSSGKYKVKRPLIMLTTLWRQRSSPCDLWPPAALHWLSSLLWRKLPDMFLQPNFTEASKGDLLVYRDEQTLGTLHLCVCECVWESRASLHSVWDLLTNVEISSGFLFLWSFFTSFCLQTSPEGTAVRQAHKNLKNTSNFLLILWIWAVTFRLTLQIQQKVKKNCCKLRFFSNVYIIFNSHVARWQRHPVAVMLL